MILWAWQIAPALARYVGLERLLDQHRLIDVPTAADTPSTEVKPNILHAGLRKGIRYEQVLLEQFVATPVARSLQQRRTNDGYGIKRNKFPYR